MQTSALPPRKRQRRSPIRESSLSFKSQDGVNHAAMCCVKCGRPSLLYTAHDAESKKFGPMCRPCIEEQTSPAGSPDARDLGKIASEQRTQDSDYTVVCVDTEDGLTLYRVPNADKTSAYDSLHALAHWEKNPAYYAETLKAWEDAGYSVPLEGAGLFGCKAFFAFSSWRNNRCKCESPDA